MMAITVFEVLDNFLGTRDCPNAELFTYNQIRELRHHVLEYYEAFEPLPRTEHKTRLFLGGFLSSPPFSVESSPYLTSAMLCADSIVLFDPLHYWFCEKQYLRSRLPSAPPGWKDSSSKRPDYERTKQYLVVALNWLYQLRPLIDAGIIVLVPAEQILASGLATWKTLAKEIEALSEPLDRLPDRFSPEEITIDDNRKGLFVFAGGSRKVQLRKALKLGIQYFAKDIIIANGTGTIYSAPFRWEQHLSELSFNEYEAIRPYASIVEGTRRLRLPLLTGLSPEVLAKIHKDSKYLEFRTGLSDALRSIDAEIGSPDFAKRVAEIENEILLPKVQAIHQEVRSAKLSTLVKLLQEGFITFAQTFVANWASGVEVEKNLMASGMTGALTPIIEMLKERTGSSDRRIWTLLIPNKPALPVYGSPLTLKETPGEITGWEIDPYPSQQVKVSAGLMKFPWFLQAQDAFSDPA